MIYLKERYSRNAILVMYCITLKRNGVVEKKTKQKKKEMKTGHRALRVII